MKSVSGSVRRYFSTLLVLCILPMAQNALGSPPKPFHILYDAHYGGMKAESERRLIIDDAETSVDQRSYTLQALSRVKLLGRSLATITEESHFLWQNDLPLPLQYSFDQSGLGKRQRSGSFDHGTDLLVYNNNGQSGELPFEEPVYDDLNAFLVIRQQLSEGRNELEFKVLDRDKIKSYHYRVIARETLETALGSFASIHLERVRDADSKRTTELWVAPQQDYLLLKLLQEEPNGRMIKLELAEAMLDGAPLSADTVRVP